MGIKLNTILLLVAFSTICATCKKNCVTATYIFKIGVKANPNLDSIYIGDTTWLNIDEPTMLQNLETGNPIDFSNATNLGSNIGFQEVLSATQFRNAANDFNYKLIFGLETPNANPQLFREFLFAG